MEQERVQLQNGLRLNRSAEFRRKQLLEVDGWVMETWAVDFC